MILRDFSNAGFAIVKISIRTDHHPVAVIGRYHNVLAVLEYQLWLYLYPP
ncbi:hypothetical protein HN51_067022 [Arachis hypogaea]